MLIVERLSIVCLHLHVLREVSIGLQLIISPLLYLILLPWQSLQVLLVQLLSRLLHMRLIMPLLNLIDLLILVSLAALLMRFTTLSVSRLIHWLIKLVIVQ